MIYVLLDTNIWIYLLEDTFENNQFIERFFSWVMNGHIKILLPECIITEWNKKKDEQVKKLKSYWLNFFKTAKKILTDSKMVNEYKNPDFINKLIEQRFSDIEEIFNQYSQQITITDNIRINATKMAQKDLAPFKGRKGVVDALVYLSFIDYIQENDIYDSYFVSENHKDFSKSKEEKELIHPDLKDVFEIMKVNYFSNRFEAINQLSKHLPSFDSYKILKERGKESNKLTVPLFNPEALEDLNSFTDNYLENIKHLDLILDSKQPTKSQMLFVLGLFESDMRYYGYFLNKLENPIWFDILYDRSYFSHQNNPDPIKVENIIWPVLQYLENISRTFSKKENLDLIEKVLKIITDVSSHPKDNYRTWHAFINILINIPNDRIPLSIFDYIKTWLNSDFETDLQSSVICKGLLQKFLNKNSSEEDIKKAEKILKILFSIRKKKEKKIIEAYSDIAKSYLPFVSLYWLKEALIDKNLINIIAECCSDDLIYQLLNSIRLILTDYPSGKRLGIEYKGNKYLIRIKYNNNDLELEIHADEENTVYSTIINNYENLTEEDLFCNIENFLKNSELVEPSKKNLNSLIETIFDDLSYIWIYSLHFIKEEYRDGDGIFKTFSLILIELLDLKIKKNPKNIIKMMKDIESGTEFRFPFFKRIVLHTISNNWNNETKQLFWEMLNNDDKYGYFSNHYYSKEIYYSLYNNIHKFNIDERNILNNIIEKGPQKEIPKDSKGYTDYWKFEWYSALREDEEYKDKYESLSKKLNIGYEEFERTGFVFTKLGTVSPFTIEEILNMNSDKIVQSILSFRPESSFEEPSIEGFSDMLNKAVQENPHKFSNQIKDFLGLPYIYIYHILNGFREAWKAKKKFNWNDVLEFCLEYIKDPKFSKNKLKIKNDNWNADLNWVVGSIANLISEGIRKDENVLKVDLMPKVKEILFLLVDYLEVKKDYKETSRDFPTYTLNTTEGKVIHALFDYSWQNSRKNCDKEDLVKWEDDIKNIFNEIRKKKIIDIYILQGWYFNQFYYLDKEWAEQYVKEYYLLEDDLWFPFICGYGYATPMYRKDIYKLLRPHFKRMIDEKRVSKQISNHLAVYYIWDYESLKQKSIFKQFIDNAAQDNFNELIYFLSGEVKYYRTMKDKEKKINFYNKIINLWEYILSIKNKLDNEDNDEKIRLLNFTVFIDELDNNLTDLIINSVKRIIKNFDAYRFIKELIRLKENGEPIKTAKYIGIILKSILEQKIFPLYMNQDNMEELVIFLYVNDQKETADYICNTYAENENTFLKDIYNKYN